MSNQYKLILRVTPMQFSNFIHSFGNDFFSEPKHLQHTGMQFQSMFGSYMTWYASTGTLTCYGKPRDEERLFTIVKTKYELFIQEILSAE